MAEDSIVLGKRKLRESDGENSSGSTIFVSNIPYTATSTDLKTLFSDFAPVRSAFVVLEDGKSKGVGYVSFAIREDARTTLETIEKDGLEVNGRKLRVQMADRKTKEKTDEPKVRSERKTPSPPKATQTKLPKDPNSIRTIVTSGLPSHIDKKALWKKVRKLEGAESVELVDRRSGVAHVLFSTSSAAAHAVDKLHAHVFKGAILSVTLKKRLENLTKDPLKKEGVTMAAAPSRSSRLIVRNLPWDITEKDLRALFLPFGPIYSINIPMNNRASSNSGDAEPNPKSEKDTKSRAKGFAFVWFFSKKDAERAIEGANGRAVEAGTIVAPTLNKKERQRLRRQLREQKRSGEGGEAGEDESDEEDEDEGRDHDDDEVSVKSSKNRATKARVLAVDWALSKDKWEEAKARMLDDQGTSTLKSGADSGNESENDEEIHGLSGSESGSEMDVDEAWDEQEHGREEEGRSDTEEGRKPILPQTGVGTTIFVRNVPFEATEDELRILFRAFGALRYARVTIDPETGRSRGTGFVCFWNREDADKAIHQSELLKRETVAAVPAQATPKKNPFSLPSLLTPDPSSSLAHSLALHGRTLDVTRAVTRHEAVRLKDEGERQREKADKRNLYLLREGVVFPNSTAASALPPGEVEKRQASFNARRNLLKSNPSLYVSKTRLSIRQLPPFVSDRGLKRLGVHAVRAFEEDVKRGDREPLTPEELHADKGQAMSDSTAEIKDKKDGRYKKRGERETGVKQAKIVRQTDRIDSLTGKGRSRGYGFLEMIRHSDALRVLRWANNNPAVNQLFEAWWRSEVEDMVKTLEKTGQTKAPKVTKPKVDEETKKAETEVRSRRLKTELERLQSGSGEGKKSKKTLIVEFSIENAQVVNRRREKIEAMKTVSKRGRSNSVSILSGDEDEDASATAGPPKRRKIEMTRSSKRGTEDTKDAAKGERKTESEAKDEEPARAGKVVGSIIGRKRKLRKAKSKSKA